MTARPAVLVELDKLRATATEAGERVDLLREQQAQTERRHAAAKAPLQAYFEAIGAGAPEDPAVEAKLRGDLAEVESTLTTRIARPTGSDHELVVVDEAIEAKMLGAETALAAARRAVAAFVRGRRDDLTSALVPMAVEAGGAVLDAIAMLLEADSRWEAVRDEWAPVLQVLRPNQPGLQHSPADVALSSFSPIGDDGRQRDGRALFPAPVDLVPADAVPDGWATSPPPPQPVAAAFVARPADGAAQRFRSLGS
jgi:hypothetical protein